ncbi:MAG: PQQ-binding-like beta-propeller repeat protein, partial [Thermoplasmatota archaeon]
MRGTGFKKETVIVLLFVLAMLPGVRGDAGWTSFRGDPQNTGSTSTALEEGDLSLLWEYRTDTAVSKAVISSADWAVACTINGTVYRLDLASGSVDWTYHTGASVSSAPLFIDDMIVVCDSSGRATAVSIDEGKRIWSFDTGSQDQIQSSPNGEDRIHFGSDDSSLYALDTEGNLLWDYTGCGGWVYTTPAVYQGKVYFGACDG